MIKIYGKVQSRAARCMWVLEELGLDYEQVPLNTQNGETRTPAYLALNPLGKVPTLDDDGYILRESLAISFYLAAKAPTPLWPADVQTQGLIHQWASWAATEVEAALGIIISERKRAAGGATIDQTFIADRIAYAEKALGPLETQLTASPYVVGEDFTLADIMACSTVMLVPMFIDLAPYPAIGAWMKRCMARPAWQRVAPRP